MWDPARWFAVLLRYDVLNDNQVQQLFELFQNLVNETLNSQNKHKIQQAMQRVAQINTQEQQNVKQIQNELDQILGEI